ncbi:MAG TPA: VacB/RNase II family 3'-5' exoribonuclease, partial [Spongiibacteraceae bacterium]|nr:VacB/RNase II family 3'-5' exoribonuclease [Spongiibacteraceae bacterium]
MLNNDALSQLRQLKQTIQEQVASHTGTVKASQGRFGFVVMDDGREIYLPPEQMLRVFPDDRVEIDIVASAEGKPSATIVKMLSSTLGKFSGQYVVRDNAHFVEPDLPRFNRWLFVPPKMRGSARHGDYVCASICRHPLSDGKAQARIDRVIGNASHPGIETRYALQRFQLPDNPPVLIEADLIEPNLQQRRDLTALPFVTIDGIDTLDMDDALYAEPLDDGWRLLVAIADPSAWIKADSKLEQAIAARATSIYLPGATIPMLPEQLANERCALQAGVERLALVCEMRIDASGHITAYEFIEARIISCAKLSYEGTSEFLARNSLADSLLADNQTGDEAWASSVRALSAVAGALRGQRQREQVLLPERAEYRFELDAQQKIAGYRREEKNAAQQLVEQCMVATNRCAAEFLARDRAPFTRHNGYRSERREIIAQLLAEQLPQLQNADVGELAAYTELQRLLATIEHPLPLREIFMRSLERSQFSSSAAPHFGMGLAQYITITSPIRKYHDFLAHRIIKAKLNKAALPRFNDALLTQLQDAGDRTRQASKLAEQWLNCQYLQKLVPATDSAEDRAKSTVDGATDNAGHNAANNPATDTGASPVFQAEIVHVTSSGLVVRLVDSGIEGFIDTRHSGEKFSFDNVYMRLSSATRKFELEQRVEVGIAAIDLKRRSINFQLVIATDTT